MSMILESIERSEKGPLVKEKEFSLDIFKRAKNLASEYKIKYDPNVLVPSDDDLADRVYKAGLQLALDVGLFCTNTNRKIMFSETELNHAVRGAPHKLWLGEGADKVIMEKRGLDAKTYCVVAGGGAGMPVTEDLYESIMASCITNPVVDTFGGSLTFHTIYGRMLRAGSPLEALLLKRELMYAHQALRRVGRPGLHMIHGGGGSTALSAIAGASSEGGLRKIDGLLIGVLPELKVDYVVLALAIHMADYGGIPISLLEPVVGGFAGSTEGCAIVGVAVTLLSTAALGVKYHLFGPVNARYPASSTNPECLWMEMVVGQALTRNTDLLITNNILASGGPLTKMLLYEVAAATLGSIPSGWHMGPGAGGASTQNVNHCSGLEAQFMGECARAATGLERSKVNDVVGKLVQKYQDQLKQPPIGVTFPECYDAKTLTPKPEWLNMLKEVKNEIEQLGIPIQDTIF